MAPLPPGDKQKLRNAGYSEEMIKTFETNRAKLPVAVRSRMSALVSSIPVGTSFNFPKSTPTPSTNRAPTAPGGMGQIINSSGTFTPNPPAPAPRQPFTPGRPTQEKPGFDLSSLWGGPGKAPVFDMPVIPRANPYNVPTAVMGIPANAQSAVRPPSTVSLAQPRPKVGSGYGAGYGQGGAAGGTPPGWQGSSVGSSVGSAATRPQVTYTDEERQREDEALDRRTPGRQAEIDLTDLNQNTGPAVPGAPVYPEINVPELVMRDFTEKARAAMNAAATPVYAAIEAGKTNARQQQSRSDQIISGLYSNLANDILAAGDTQAKQYRQSGDNAQAAARALEKQYAEIYNGSNSDEAALARSLGQEQAVGELIANNATERQFQQGQAAEQGAAQEAYYNQGAQAASDYNTELAGAARTEGAGRRSDLIQDLANVLTSYDQQKAGVESDFAVRAIEQANTLSDRDMRAQETNINAILSKAGLLNSQISNQNAADWNAYNALVAQRDAEAKRLADIIAAEEDKRRWERETGLTERQVKVAEQEAAAKANQQPDLDPNSQVTTDAMSAVLNADPSTRNWPPEYVRKFADVYQKFASDVLGDPGATFANLFQFQQKVIEAANGTDMKPDILTRVAETVWNNLYGGQKGGGLKG